MKRLHSRLSWSFGFLYVVLLILGILALTRRKAGWLMILPSTENLRLRLLMIQVHPSFVGHVTSLMILS